MAPRNSSTGTEGKGKGKAITLRVSERASSHMTRLGAAWGDVTAKAAQVDYCAAKFAALASEGYVPSCLNAIESALYTVTVKVSEETGKRRITVNLTIPADAPALLNDVLGYKESYEANDLLNMGANAAESLAMIDLLARRNDGEELIAGITGKPAAESKGIAVSLLNGVLSRREATTFRNLLDHITTIKKAATERVNAIKAREANAPDSQPREATPIPEGMETPTTSDLANLAVRKREEEEARARKAAKAAAAKAARDKAAAAAKAAADKTEETERLARKAAAADSAAAAAAALPGATGESVRKAAREAFAAAQ